MCILTMLKNSENNKMEEIGLITPTSAPVIDLLHTQILEY